MGNYAAHPKQTEYLYGLKPRREARGLTQRELADLIGGDRESIRAWETGVYWPSAQYLPKLAAALGCRMEDLYRLPGEDG